MPSRTLRARDRVLTFHQPLVMGIVNINDDSFSGDGSLEVDRCLEQAARMAREGADMIDVGAESARTNRGPIPVEEEIERLAGFFRLYPEWLAGLEGPFLPGQLWPPLLSVNTWRPEVVEASLVAGAELINDISGLPDDRNARLCAEHGAALLVMHSVGEPKVRHTTQRHEDVLATIDAFFEGKLRLCESAGLAMEQTVLDPGIDFAKQRDDNLKVYAGLERFHRFGRPILLPVSRKTVIGEVLGIDDPRERDAGTVACIVSGLIQGAAIFRVHHVHAAVQTVRTVAALTL